MEHPILDSTRVSAVPLWINTGLFFEQNRKTKFLDSKNSVTSFSTKLGYFHKNQLKIGKNQFFGNFFVCNIGSDIKVSSFFFTLQVIIFAKISPVFETFFFQDLKRQNFGFSESVSF